MEKLRKSQPPLSNGMIETKRCCEKCECRGSERGSVLRQGLIHSMILSLSDMLMAVIKWADKEKKGGEKRYAKGIGLEEDTVELGGVSHAAYARAAVQYMNTRCQRCNHIRADHEFNYSSFHTPCSPLNENEKGYHCKCQNFVEYGELESRDL